MKDNKIIQKGNVGRNSPPKSLPPEPCNLLKEEPYLWEPKTTIILKYNSNYGDGRVCKCGHIYYRHFDPYEDMEAVGCKYCMCNEFVEES
jgi:hypothetical protein